MKQLLRWQGRNHPKLPVILTIPHSGEHVPDEASWLSGVSPQILLTDVDRFVDELYLPVCEVLGLPALVTGVHRYAADLNRFPEDVDSESVNGSVNPPGTFPKGFHWVVTTLGERIMSSPISRSQHEELVRKYHDRFHEELARKVSELRKAHPRIYHLDCHSMPSVGTGAHTDQGSRRPDVVISDFNGKSASPAFKDQVLAAFRKEGLETSYNWPYQGGRITQRYGKPLLGHETIQIELNRALYMDENTKEKLLAFNAFSLRLERVLAQILQGLQD